MNQQPLTSEERERRIAERDAELAKRLEDWRNGGDRAPPIQPFFTALRLKDGNVQTSNFRDLLIGRADWLALFKLATECKEIGMSRDWRDFQNGPMFGPYRLDSIGSDGTACIDCHSLKHEELARLVAQFAAQSAET